MGGHRLPLGFCRKGQLPNSGPSSFSVHSELLRGLIVAAAHRISVPVHRQGRELLTASFEDSFGLQPKSDGLHPTGNGLQPNRDSMAIGFDILHHWKHGANSEDVSSCHANFVIHQIQGFDFLQKKVPLNKNAAVTT